MGKEITHPQSQYKCHPWCQWPPRLGPSRASSHPVGSIESQPEEVTDAGFPPSQSLMCRPSHSSTQLSGVQGAPLRLAPQRQGRKALRHWVGFQEPPLFLYRHVAPGHGSHSSARGGGCRFLEENEIRQTLVVSPHKHCNTGQEMCSARHGGSSPGQESGAPGAAALLSRRQHMTSGTSLNLS